MLCFIDFYLYSTFIFLLSTFRHIFALSGPSSPRCFGEADILKWNRSLNFDNRLLTLKLAVVDEPANWIINYLFEFLARERLGYKDIEFIRQPSVTDIQVMLSDLKCMDRSCETLPNVHLNLLLWLPVGVNVDLESNAKFVTDLGPLGPTRQWSLTTQAEFKRRRDRFPDSLSACSQNSRDLDTVASLIRKESLHMRNTLSGGFRRAPVTVHEIQLNDTVLMSRSFVWSDPPVCQADNDSSDQRVCRTEAYQAVKLAWANLSSASPPLFKLASRMRLTTDEFTELLRQVKQSVDALNRSRADFHSSLHTAYRENACRWLRRNPVKWKKWTEGWNQKLNLTVAGMFSVYGKWILPGLQEAAEVAVRFVNGDPDYFRNSEYALKLDIRNLSCEPGMVLSEYFKILAGAPENRLIGSIAALCSDSMEAMVELANLRKKLIISPTVATARFLEQQHFPHFFRTVPAMTEANYVLLRLFLTWGWRRVAVFRKRDHFFNPRLFQANSIEIIADIQEEESQLTYGKARNSLNSLKLRNSRIFVIEYDARGTYLILCAAYHLGMHSRTGYVWFLNPWLSSNWWTQPSLASLRDCTYDEMANITSWTFTVGHQWLIPQMLHSLTRLSIPKPSSSPNQSSFSTSNTDTNLEASGSYRVKRHALSSGLPQNSHDVPPTSLKPIQSSGYDPTEFYLAYTTDAVMTLASALVNLLKENPSAISALDKPSVAEAFRNWVARTEFGYGSAAVSKDKASAKEDFFLGFGFQAAGEFYGVRQPGFGNSTSGSGAPRLRFNVLNERIADHWLLKQHLANTTVPIFVWVADASNVDIAGEEDTDRLVGNEGTLEILLNLTGSTDQSGDLLADFNRFERQMKMRPLDKVTWITPGGPPDDGSIDPDKNCAFQFLSQTLRMGCTGATVFIAVTFALLSMIPIILASLHYRRKLREAEKRTRKPFEELCTELADLDMPVETIVLNRRIGQGAFGLVFGGEAKNNGCWEAVAVKVINEKATYEGKIDFLSEAKLMRSLKHRNVVRLIGISLGQKENLYLVMELMLLGDLKTYLLSRRILAQRSPDHEDIRPSTLTQMSIDIAQGLSYLHSKHLIHRDIACRNCLVGSDHVVKIGDFGLTREATKNKPECYYRFTRNCELPIRWMSPEAVQYGIFSVQSDVWSYGITLYEVVTFGVFPYNNMGDVEVVERVKRMEFSIADFLPASARNTVVCQLIKQCCQHQWKNRPSSMHQVLQILFDYPECVRPFLTDDPPKPIGTSEQLPFQPFSGACLVPEANASDCVQLSGGCSSIPMHQFPATVQRSDFADKRFYHLHTPIRSPTHPFSEQPAVSRSSSSPMEPPRSQAPVLHDSSASLDVARTPGKSMFHLHPEEIDDDNEHTPLHSAHSSNSDKCLISNPEQGIVIRRDRCSSSDALLVGPNDHLKL